jgi:hypothetical protein
MRPREEILWRRAAVALLGQIRVGNLTVVAGADAKSRGESRRWSFGSGAPAARIEIPASGRR